MHTPGRWPTKRAETRQSSSASIVKMFYIQRSVHREIYANNCPTRYNYHRHHISLMELGHLLTRSGLTYTEVPSKVYHDSFCQLGSSISLPWVIYVEAFYLHVVSSPLYSSNLSKIGVTRIFNSFAVCWRIKDQLDVTCCFISLLICSTCFGH